MNPIPISLPVATAQDPGPLVDAGINPADLPQNPSDLLYKMKDPLTNIYLSVGILSTDLNDPDYHICLDIIMRNSIRINDMINAFHNARGKGIS